MKVVYLNSSGHLGGVEHALLDLFASLRDGEPAWVPHLVVPAEGAFAEQARAVGIGTTVLPFPARLERLGDAGAGGPAGRTVGRAALARRLLASSPSALRYVRLLRRELRGLAPDVIHTSGFKMHALGAWARPRRTPVVWHMHDYAGSRPVMARVLRASARGCAAVVANSQSVADDVRAVCGARPGVRAVYNAVNLERFSPQGVRADLDALAGLPPAEPGTIRVGLVSTLARWKGHATFLRALSLLPARLPVRGYVTGDALYRTEGSQFGLEELRRMAEEFGVARRVGFTGFVADAAAAMRALDVVVHASTAPEPFGLVIAEAMACGRAVIVAQAGGAAEIISAGTDALAHAPGDADALAARIAQLATDARLRESLGRAARATAERRFDRRRLAAEWVPIYRELTETNFNPRKTDVKSESRDAAIKSDEPLPLPLQSAMHHPKSATD